MIAFALEEKGVQDTILGLSRLSSHLEDYRNIWPEVVDRIREVEERAFSSEGSTAAHGRFAALSPAYAAEKARRYPGAPILTRTGLLRNSLTRPRAAGAYFVTEKTRMEFGTTVPYAVYHERGVAGRMPARRPLDLTRAQLIQILTEPVQTYVYAGVKAFHGRSRRFS